MTPNLSYGHLGSIAQYGLPFGTQGISPALGLSLPMPAPVSVPAPAMAAAAVKPAVSDTAATAADAAKSLSLGDWAKGLFMQDGKVNLEGLSDLFGVGTSLANIIGGFQANSIAKDALNFQKSAYKTNLANELKSYNTALSDRSYARYAQEGRSADEARQYIEENRLGA